MNHQRLPVVLFMTCICLLFSDGANARVSSLTGSISIREGYDSNIDRTQNNEISGMTTTISPTLQLNSQGEYDTVSIGYSPGFSFDHKTDENHVDHHFYLSGNRNFTKLLQGSLRETFIQSEDTYIESETLQLEGIRLIREYNRKDRLWTNTLSMQMAYEYAMGSIFTMSYANHILHHLTSTTGNDDYIRHNPLASLSYQINHQWDFEVFYGYIKGDFDVSDDLTTHNPGIRLNYHHTPASNLYGTYVLRDTNYSGNQREDYRIHDVSLGIDHEINPETKVTLSVGATRVDRSIANNENGFNASVNLTKSTKKGSFNITGKSGFDESNFSGEDKGLSRYWSTRCSFAYQLTEQNNLDVFAGVRDDDYKQSIIGNDEKTYYGGGSLSFAFARWYTVSLGYNYLRFETDDPTRDDYVDHRIYLAFAAAKELWRW